MFGVAKLPSLARCDGRLRGRGKKLSQSLELGGCARRMAWVRRRQEPKLVARLHVPVGRTPHVEYLGSISQALKMTIRKARPFRVFSPIRGVHVYYCQSLIDAVGWHARVGRSGGIPSEPFLGLSVTQSRIALLPAAPRPAPGLLWPFLCPKDRSGRHKDGPNLDLLERDHPTFYLSTSPLSISPLAGAHRVCFDVNVPVTPLAH